MSHTLYAPWRLDYIKSVADGPKECFLCSAAQHPERDDANLILARSANSLLMLNKYPYVNGHLLVAPYRHAPTPVECTPEERAEMMELLVLGQQALERAMNPQGFNVGINIGKVSGAGVPGHIHAHIVPRWNGDINFMTIVGNVRIIPQAIEEAFRQLKTAIAALHPST
ncbi:MAG TPA: HIT domain-containing protein [Phycisphaerae bacterium]|nr:HIT domain-containing protein [Phycisphaerae bacterium]